MSKQPHILKNQLDKEMQHLTFEGHEKVKNRLHAMTRRQKIQSIWHKEIEIPIMPVVTLFMVFLLFTGTRFSTTSSDPTAATKDHIIRVADNYYWKSAFEKQIQHADQTQQKVGDTP